MSHKTTNRGCTRTWLAFTSLVPSRMRKLKQTSSTDVPVITFLYSISIVSRAQLSLSTAWLGQQSLLVGSFGGATRREGSRARQSPCGLHGGARQDSWSMGTHTSWPSHDDVELLRRQFGRPHQRFEHFGCPLTQMQELQSESSSWAASSGLAREVGCEAFRHTEVGLERTRIQKIVRFGKLKKRSTLHLLTHFTSSASPSWRTTTRIPTDPIHTGSAAQTGLR